MEIINTFKEIPKTFQSYKEFESYKERCRSCPVGLVYNKVVLSCGNKINPTVVIIGEAPGQDEIEQGEPFVGKSGKLLRATLKKYGFSSSNSLITNTIPCRPENNKFPKDDKLVTKCKNMWLKTELTILQPDYLLLIGSQSLKFLLGLEGITKCRGKWYRRKLNGKTISIMPTYHPSYVLRVQYSPYKKYVAEDFEKDIMSVGNKAFSAL